MPQSNESAEKKSKDAIDQVLPSQEPPLSSNVDDGELLAPKVRVAAERRLVNILDARLLPTIVLIFIMNYIDRVAVSSARLKGLSQDLGLSDIQYSTVLAVLYASYISVQIPSNMFLNRIARPSYYIPLCVILWGLTSALTGVVTSYSGILVARIFVGVPEAAFYPGAIYLLSRWYTRKELAFRSAFLYGGLLISNSFGSLMAAGILSRMEGKLGVRAWRWLFYIEGAITIFIGLVAIFVLPDYPHNTRWLTPAQRRLAKVRLAEDAGEADDDVATDTAWAGLVMALKDPKVSLFAIMVCTQLLGQGFINFFPTIAGTLGFSTTVTLLIAAPPWILAAILCGLNAWHADHTGERFLHICAPSWGVIVGYIIGLSTSSTAGRYVALFFLAGGYAGFALDLVWVANSIPRPPAKRTAAIALVNGFGNAGNLISSYTWKVTWGPDYHPSMIIGIVSLVLATILAFGIRQMLVRENKRLDWEEFGGASDNAVVDASRERVKVAAQLEGVTLDEAFRRRQGFRYLI